MNDLNNAPELEASTDTAIDYSTCYAESLVSIISKLITLKRCVNNHKVYISSECFFCGYKGRRVFRYNSKIKIGKSFCCGKSFKDISQLKEEIRYINWHKDKLCMNYRRFEQFKIVDDNLPF